MIRTRDINIRMIIAVAKRLGNLRDKVVFVGGCATGLFVTDPAIPEVRATQDAAESERISKKLLDHAKSRVEQLIKEAVQK